MDGRTHGQTDGRTDLSPALLRRLCLRVDLNISITVTGSKNCILCIHATQTSINVRVEQLRQFLSYKLHRVTMGLGIRRTERGKTKSNFLHARQFQHLAQLAEQVC